VRQVGAWCGLVWFGLAGRGNQNNTGGDWSRPNERKHDMADKKFDPEGTGYDYETAKKRGIKPDETGHWPSRDPKTGVLLKGRGHKTWHKTVTGEEKAGYEIYKRGDRYYSRPKKNKKK